MIELQTLIYAFLGGLLPALVWLAFWLYEDHKHPEPRGLILRTFIFGMIAVIVVLPIQKMVDARLPGLVFAAVLLWVILEEIVKLLAAYFGGLKSREDNEPIDPLIYMITAALGFVALENSLFIFGALIGKETMQGLITGNLRFIGASLLHVVSSGIIGAALSLSFFKSKVVRFWSFIFSLFLAIIIHTGFNLTILHWSNAGTIIVFVLVWIGVISLLLLFEKIKAIAR